jgi:hypothetical protein
MAAIFLRGPDDLWSSSCGIAAMTTFARFAIDLSGDSPHY